MADKAGAAEVQEQVTFTGFTPAPGGSGGLPPPDVDAPAESVAKSSAPPPATATKIPVQKPDINSIAKLPKILGELKAECALDPMLLKLFEKLGADDTTELGDLACVSESD